MRADELIKQILDACGDNLDREVIFKCETDDYDGTRVYKYGKPLIHTEHPKQLEIIIS